MYTRTRLSPSCYCRFRHPHPVHHAVSIVLSCATHTVQRLTTPRILTIYYKYVTCMIGDYYMFFIRVDLVWHPAYFYSLRQAVRYVALEATGLRVLGIVVL
jgi:hypothetical protein